MGTLSTCSLLIGVLAATQLGGRATAAMTPSFSPPLLVSAPVQCYDSTKKQLCGYLQNDTCKCPGYPTAAGGTDGFYGLDSNATRMIGLYNQFGMEGNELTYTSDGGKTWRLKKFSEPAASFDWNLYPVAGGTARRNFGAISQGAFLHGTHGSMTDRSWIGNQSATFSFDGDELQMDLTGAVSVGPMPAPVNHTNGKCVCTRTRDRGWRRSCKCNCFPLE
eukprot:COSAG02_NODE_1622_length_11607_cov_6.986097_8_plen_220_part_00